MPDYADINLHPSSHAISQLGRDTYDVICIGSGWAGRIIAARVVAAGLSALIVESELIGGDCPFWACVPSKVLLRSAEALDEASSVGGSRERLNSAGTVDVAAVFGRRDKFTAGWNDQVVLTPLVESSGADMVRGVGRVTGEKQVTVEAVDGQRKVFTARRAVAVCTGSVPAMPAVPGLVEANPWTPRQATSTSKAPKRLIIIGAGAVGCEVATMYSSFGTKVTLISSGDRILSKFEPEAAKVVQDSLVAKGVQLHFSNLTRVDRSKGQIISAVLGNGSVIEAEEILVAAGRRAQTDGLGLEAFGLPTDGSSIPVTESLCVASVPGGWLYAAGDINGRHPLTHGSKYHGRIIANAIVAGKSDEQEWSSTSATADKVALPQVVFTSPTITSVGLTKASAKKAGISYREITAPSRTLASAIHSDNVIDGWAQWVVEQPSGRLLGATLVGDGVGELLHAYTVAIVGGMTLERLAHAVPSFPTLGEVHLNLLEAAGF